MLDNRPLVSCWIMGQLGNQMFQIATTLAYAWDHNAIPIFHWLNRTEDRISYNRDRIFFRLNTTLPPRRLINTFQESKNYSSAKIPFKNDLILYGYFQTWRHFDHHREKILSAFAPGEEIQDSLQMKYRNLIALPNTVAVHVRAWCKSLHDSRLHPFLGLKYYQKALDRFSPDSLFVVFSDRIDWCKKHFLPLNRNFIFIDGNDGIEDFFLMSLMKNAIISNSTYSWWAAYMNRHLNKIIIAPQVIIDPCIDPAFPFEDFFLPQWKLVEVDLDEPYPMDIELHPTQSTNG